MALILLTVALSVYAPFAGEASCAAPSCCAQEESCCAHCHCPAQQTCSVAKPLKFDQQAPVRVAQLSPRISVELFTLASLLPPSMESKRSLAWSKLEAPPPKIPQSPQSLLCLWLI